TGACEDVTQSKTADVADPSQAAAVEGDCRRERFARDVAQLRAQGWGGRDGEVRGTDQGAGRGYSRSGRLGRANAYRSAGTARTDCRPVSPLAGDRQGR